MTATFPYYGGKTSHLRKILPLLGPCAHYCEPFAGSAAVLVAREPSMIETLNDADGDVVNFWRVLRDDGDRLRQRIEFTPFSRAEFEASVAAIHAPPADPLERARLFYVRLGQGRMAKMATTRGQWCWSREKRGLAVASWVSRVERLEALAARLHRVQVENTDAVSCIRHHDSPETLFYVDPPYVGSVRCGSSLKAYRHEMTDDAHKALLAALLGIRGFACVSGYASPLYDSALAGWNRTEWKAVARQGVGRATSTRTEVVWRNYETAP
jgi:DNA adenine methylase